MVEAFKEAEAEVDAPRNPINTALNDIEIKDGAMGIGNSKIQSVGPNEWAGLKKGDKVAASAYADAFKKEGDMFNAKATWNGVIENFDVAELKKEAKAKLDQLASEQANKP